MILTIDDGGGGGGGKTISSIVQTRSSNVFGYLKLFSVPATDCMSKLVSISIEMSGTRGQRQIHREKCNYKFKFDSCIVFVRAHKFTYHVVCVFLNHDLVVGDD